MPEVSFLSMDLESAYGRPDVITASVGEFGMVNRPRGWRSQLTGVIIAGWLSGGVAQAQVTPPLIATLKERASAIEGTCIPKATVQVVVKADKTSIRLDDAICSAAGRFSVDAAA